MIIFPDDEDDGGRPRASATVIAWFWVGYATALSAIIYYILSK